MDFQLLFESNTVILHIIKVYVGSEALWENNYLPDELKSNTLGKGQAFFLDTSPVEIGSLVSIEEFKHFLSENGFHENILNNDNGSNRLFLLVDKEKNITPFFSFKDEDKLFKISTVVENENVDRRQSDLRLLKDKKVGIVGVGSLGSKVANSLARTGVESFLLIDEDVFLSGNIQRHTLDWRSVGAHKIDAIQEQLKLISSSIEVNTSTINLTGQESASALNAVVSRLGACDVIVDATADSKVFNLLAALCERYDKPLVLGEVFAGGIGGLISRSRRRLDPSPQTMRKALFETTHDVPTISQVEVRPYELESETGEVWIASDIDVGVIANHLAGFIIYTLKEGESDYSYSMYLIGLKKAWVFEEPFATFPIRTDHLIEEKLTDENHQNIKEVIEFLVPLLKGSKGD